MRDVCAVFVTHNPDRAVLGRAVAAVADQVHRVYIVDNGSTPAFDLRFADPERVEVVILKKNEGIAAGFNAGIRLGSRAGYRYVLLLDQDSVPPAGMVRRYVEAYEQLLASGIRVAALGPRYRDRRTGHISRFVRYRWFRNAYAGSGESNPIIPADFLISSGSFYETRIFEEVGPFEERLFIDHVDTEWSHRANSLGFRSFGVSDLVLEHAIGEGCVRLWLGRWRQQPLHKPFRLYYIVRNSLLIYRLPHIPMKWISSDLLRLLRMLLVYLFFSPRRCEALIWMGRGVRDGVHGISGPVVPPYDLFPEWSDP